MWKLHSDCKSLQFGPLLPVHAVVVALAVRLDCNHRYHHNNGEERGRLKCIIKLQREELELVSMQRLRRGLFDRQLCFSLIHCLRFFCRPLMWFHNWRIGLPRLGLPQLDSSHLHSVQLSLAQPCLKLQQASSKPYQIRTWLVEIWKRLNPLI